MINYVLYRYLNFIENIPIKIPRNTPAQYIKRPKPGFAPTSQSPIWNDKTAIMIHKITVNVFQTVFCCIIFILLKKIKLESNYIDTS